MMLFTFDSVKTCPVVLRHGCDSPGIVNNVSPNEPADVVDRLIRLIPRRIGTASIDGLNDNPAQERWYVGSRRNEEAMCGMQTRIGYYLLQRKQQGAGRAGQSVFLVRQ